MKPGDLVVIRHRGPGLHGKPPNPRITTWVYHKTRGDIKVPDGEVGMVIEVLDEDPDDEGAYLLLTSHGLVVCDDYKVDPVQPARRRGMVRA